MDTPLLNSKGQPITICTTEQLMEYMSGESFRLFGMSKATILTLLSVYLDSGGVLPITPTSIRELYGHR